jgi:hypothetical protein
MNETQLRALFGRITDRREWHRQSTGKPLDDKERIRDRQDRRREKALSLGVKSTALMDIILEEQSRRAHGFEHGSDKKSGRKRKQKPKMSTERLRAYLEV